MHKAATEAGFVAWLRSYTWREGVITMLYWAVVYFIIAISSAIFRFAGVAA